MSFKCKIEKWILINTYSSNKRCGINFTVSINLVWAYKNPSAYNCVKVWIREVQSAFLLCSCKSKIREKIANFLLFSISSHWKGASAARVIWAENYRGSDCTSSSVEYVCLCKFIALEELSVKESSGAFESFHSHFASASRCSVAVDILIERSAGGIAFNFSFKPLCSLSASSPPPHSCFATEGTVGYHANLHTQGRCWKSCYNAIVCLIGWQYRKVHKKSENMCRRGLCFLSNWVLLNAHSLN
jgi:hypothetical protein